MAYILMMCTK